MIDRRKIQAATNSRFTRRALFLFGSQLGLAGVLGWRMYQLQVVESGYFTERAERSRMRPRLIAPVRGEIFSRDGKPLAENRQNYRITLIREQTEDIKLSLQKLATIIDLTQERQEELYEQIRKSSSFAHVLIAENLNWDEFSEVNANAPALRGISPEIGLTRHYPEAGIAAHIIGYVGAPNEEDVKRAGPAKGLLKLPGMRIGKNGIERVAEDSLRGTAGLSRVERNVHGRTIRELFRQEGTEGDTLDLTIDLGLQEYAMKRLGNESGAVIVMDVNDGDVLALASSPGYDPNNFVLGLSQKQWVNLRDNEKNPLTNKAVAGLYPPGSTFKMLTLLAALEEGININDGHFCNGSIWFGNRFFNCWKRQGHGFMDGISAIKHSCDVYFYEVAQQVGIDKIAALSRRFGLGVEPEIELPRVKSGVMPDRNWKESVLGESWYKGETLNAGIGQGYTTTTPLQLAIMTARIANGGYDVKPRLIRGRNGEPIKPLPLRPLGVNPENVALVRRAMSAVTNEQGGTGYRARISAAGKEMCGKTGTAQVRRISVAERATGVLKNEDLPWKLRDHALFVAYAPADKPRYAIAVVVEHGGGGSTVAAPIARDVLLHAQYQGKPPPDAVPNGAAPIFGQDPLGPV